jgi:crotonobetainyl-CoA hydratase
MIWTGDRMTAAEARRWGLVYQIAEPAELMPLAWSVARRVARGAPLAQQALKETLRFVSGLSDEAAMSLRRNSQGDLANYRLMLDSQDMIEGQRAFLEKREPKWQGR